MKIRLRAEEKCADVMQAYETLAIVVSRALGGESEKTENLGPVPQTAEELEAALARTFG